MALVGEGLNCSVSLCLVQTVAGELGNTIVFVFLHCWLCVVIVLVSVCRPSRSVIRDRCLAIVGMSYLQAALDFWVFHVH